MHHVLGHTLRHGSKRYKTTTITPLSHVLASPKVAATRSIPSPTNPSLKHLTFPNTHKPSCLTQEPSPAFPIHVGHPKCGTNA
ncbi:hypothetical protein PIB30_070047, partial [Stylosanthes scabra]|nr:hypothetical protein [Stylosanthes scabra]